MTTVDALDIEISSSVQNITDSIETLSKKLVVFEESLKFVDTGRLQEMASAIRSLSDGLKGTEEIEGSGVAGVADLLSELGSEITTAGVENLLKMKDSLVQFVFDMNSIGGVTFDVSGISDLLEAISEFGDKSATTGVENLLKIRDGLAQFVFNMNSIRDVMFDASGLSDLLEMILKFGDESATTGVENLLKMKDNLVQFVSDMNAVESMKFDVSSFSGLLGAILKLGDESIADAIENIPKISKEMQNFMQTLSDAPDVSANVVSMTSALAQLASQGNKAETIGNPILSAGSNKNSKSSGKISKSLSGIMGKLYTNVTKMFQKAKELWGSIESSFDYLEVLNYFDEAFGQMASSADLSSYKEMGYDSAEAYYNSFEKRAKELTAKMSGFTVGENGIMQEAEGANLGLDPTQVMKYQAMFAQMSSSMGVTSENALRLSQSLIEIGADLASAKGVGFEDVWEDIASGLGGTGEALEKYGVDLQDAALQQKLMELGLDASVSALDQNDKALLRAIVLLDSTKGAWGNLADAINQPVNQLHLIQENFQSLSKTIGSFFLPLVQKVLPYVNALVITFQRLFSWLGNLLGIDLNGISTATGDTNLGNVQKQTDKLESSLEGAKKSSDKLNRSLRQFDELKTITMKEDTDTESSDTEENRGGLLDKAFLDTYEKYQGNWDSAFANLENSALKIADKIEKAFEPVKKIIQEFIIGDFFQAGKDTSHLVAGIFDVFADAINKVNWYGIGQKIGDFIVGIDWFSIFTSVVKVVWEAFKGALEAYVGAFVSAPFETTLTTLAVAPGILEKITSSKYITDFKKLGNVAKDCFWAIGTGFKDKEIGNGFATALEEIGKNLSPFQKFSIGALGVTGEFSLIKDGFYDLTAGSDNVVKSLGEIVGGAGLAVGALKLIGLSNPWTAAIVGITGVVGALVGMKQAADDAITAFVDERVFDGEGTPIRKIADEVSSLIEKTGKSSEEMEKFSENVLAIEGNFKTAKDELDKYKLKLKETGELSEEDLRNMKDDVDLLATTLKDNLKFNVDNAFNAFMNLSGQTAKQLGIDVGDMTQILSQFQNKFGKIYDNMQEEADALIDKMLGGNVTKEDSDRLYKLLDDMEYLSADSIRRQVEMQNLIKDSLKIDFMEEAEGAKAVETIKATAVERKKEIDAYYEEVLKQTSLWKEEVKRAFEIGKIDFKTQLDYSKMLNRLTDAYAANWKSELGEIEKQTDTFFQHVLSQLAEKGLKTYQDQLELDGEFTETNRKEVSNFTKRYYYPLFKEISDARKAINKEAKEFDDDWLKFEEVVLNMRAASEYQEPEIVEASEKLIDAIKGNVTKSMREMGEAFGKDTVDGYNDAVSNNTEISTDHVGRWMENIKNAIHESAMDFGSPSKTAIQFGKDTVMGYNLGIAENEESTMEAIASYTEKILRKFSEIMQPLKEIAINVMRSFFEGLKSMESPIYSTVDGIASKVESSIRATMLSLKLFDYSLQTNFPENPTDICSGYECSIAYYIPKYSDLESYAGGYRQENQETNMLLRALLSEIQKGHVIEMDGRIVAENTRKYADNYTRLQGKPYFKM